ncbi:hypothetical protein MLD38_025597 [Melastoma candidum]|uniref:Uncharacterized protein n=1 Tax=Melastoma candidum TaxID=119954 RepID=A0ACB9NWC1_9MYRT|nr:hypothetical protein MLD38_025597 [Melastoma candidum]
MMYQKIKRHVGLCSHPPNLFSSQTYSFGGRGEEKTAGDSLSPTKSHSSPPLSPSLSSSASFIVLSTFLPGTSPVANASSLSSPDLLHFPPSPPPLSGRKSRFTSAQCT